MLNHALNQGERREASRASNRGRTINGPTDSEFDGITVLTLRSSERYWMTRCTPAIRPSRRPTR
jgi:hypothetical protein